MKKVKHGAGRNEYGAIRQDDRENISRAHFCPKRTAYQPARRRGEEADNAALADISSQWPEMNISASAAMKF